MITVTCHGREHQCATAIKGAYYIHLLDENGRMTVAFDGISDFSAFEISGGDWTTASATEDCYVVVIGSDGVPKKSTVKLCDIA